MYTKEEEIIHFVFKAFELKRRKKEKISLAFHSIMVGVMLKEINCDKTIIYTGYLHDIIEDTDYDYNDILTKYGKEIADNVLKLSEDKGIDNYVERKTNFIKKLQNISSDLLIVEVADKLQNLISDYDLYLKYGKELLITEADSYENLKWYYLSLKKLFNSKIEDNKLLDRYNKIVDIYFS